VVICLERGADLHMAQLMPLPLTVSCFSKIQIGLTFLVLAHLGSPGNGPLNGCVCVCCFYDVSSDFVQLCPDMELGHWATGSMGHLDHLSRPGHRVIILTRCETRVFPVFDKMPKLQKRTFEMLK